MYLLLGISMAIGMSAIYTPIIAAVSKWFGGRAPLPIAIVLSGYGLAQIVFPPVVTYIILEYGWQTAFIVVGVMAWGLGILAWTFVKNPPQSNLNPPPPESAGVADASKASKIQTPVKDDYTLSQALHTASFWIIFLVYLITAMWVQMIVIHIVAAATDTGLAPERAAYILTLSGITNILGRLTLGALANKFGNRIILTISVAVQAPMLFILAGASNLWVFYIFTMTHSFAAAGATPIILAISGTLFGTRSAGAIIGTLTVAYTIAIAVGPLLAGYIFDITGSYDTAFYIAAITTAVAFPLCLRLKLPHEKALNP